MPQQEILRETFRGTESPPTRDYLSFAVETAVFRR